MSCADPTRTPARPAPARSRPNSPAVPAPEPTPFIDGAAPIDPLDDEAPIEGSVVFADGQPAAFAQIDLGGDAIRTFGSKRGRCTFGGLRRVADEEGRFQIPPRHDGFDLVGPAARLVAWARSRDETAGATAPLNLNRPISMTLAPAASLRIAVVAEGVPFSMNADNYLVRVATANGELQTLISASGGQGLTLRGLPPGPFFLEEYTWCGLGPPCGGARSRGELKPGEITTRTLGVVRRGSAEGVALDPTTRRPIAGASITCDHGPCGWDPDGFWPNVTTGPEGRYRIDGLASGEHQLSFGGRLSVIVRVEPSL